MKIVQFAFLLFLCGTSVAYGASCKKDYQTCEQAVIAWCAGKHPRADGDKDGIPCENLCVSLEQVEEIKKQIKCKK